MDKIDKDDIKWGIIAISIIVLFVAFIGGMIYHGSQYTEHEYQLCEMDNGVYAIYYATHSTVPAYNYEVVTVNCNGNIYTFKGSVNISFTNNKPHMKVKSYNTINSDEVYVYVPQGTVSYQSGVNIVR